jgi:hypothetical protein
MAWDLSLLDPSSDFAIFDFQETVYYYRFLVADDSYDVPYPNIRALFREIDEDQVGIDSGDATSKDVRIHIPAADLPFIPHRLDKIVRDYGLDSESDYYVQSAKRQTGGTRFQLNCTQGAP